MPRRTQGWAALVGLVSVAGGFALAELLSLMLAPSSSTVYAVGSFAVDITPSWAKDAAIALFGTNDKIFLFVVLGLIFAAIAALAGRLELTRPPWGSALLIVFGALAVYAVATREQFVVLWLLPTVLGLLAAIVLLRMLTARLRTWVVAATAPEPSAPTAPAGATPEARMTPAQESVLTQRAAPSRRGFLTLLAGTAAGAVVVGAGARLANNAANAATAAVERVREIFRLPQPATAAPPVPAGAALEVEGVSDLVTPNEEFYRIDTALQVPAVDPETWRLRIVGMVEEEVEISFAELLDLPLTETTITLMCVSNPVGGDLIGNAVWLGYPIRELLARARPLAGADMVLSRSVDGFTASTPLEILEDPDRDCLLAVGMNGELLPPEHGFPVRMVVPGLYGYVSATKWVTELRVTTFEEDTAYWTDRGWSAMGPIKIGSRIDVPTSGSRLAAGTVPVAGVAWAQHTGISGVEVRIDEGEWQAATLAPAISEDTWVQWVHQWQAEPGTHQIEVRAIDATGEVQSGQNVQVVPDGAEGWHAVRVNVS
ncbi:molybdopterin-dependent oxidoreductase [Serinibacter salmoneus]|uniref:DMSO/TMAO reductase YedYZ molybdopterin-dependent catalytic subunit n=1 Tax=Serinibacter salmoneus TaxID=556530 RepID=A0A2A9D3H8_9MICO|nr:molybdopterin-dependent oxidoreductase [Serinibacter salmoneus]PFG21213.1 DMSO/TMAO reductase YedYZ molybdopterin-dependent catalytic subunit [Serinibacter salmoneus]